MKFNKLIIVLCSTLILVACGKKVSGDFTGVWQDKTDKLYIVTEKGIPDRMSSNREEKIYAVSEIDEFTVESKDKGELITITPDKKTIKLGAKIPFVKVN